MKMIKKKIKIIKIINKFIELEKINAQKENEKNKNNRKYINRARRACDCRGYMAQ